MVCKQSPLISFYLGESKVTTFAGEADYEGEVDEKGNPCGIGTAIG